MGRQDSAVRSWRSLPFIMGLPLGHDKLIISLAVETASHAEAEGVLKAKQRVHAASRLYLIPLPSCWNVG